MSVRDLPPARPPHSSGRRSVIVLAASLLVLLLGGCDNRGDLLGVELVVFSVGEWSGTGDQGEVLRFLLERDNDEAVLTAFLVELPGLADLLEGQSEACGAVVDAFSRFGNVDVRVPVRNAGFSFRTPNDFRVDNDGYIRARVVGRFEAPDSAVVDAEVEIDVTRQIPCRGEFMLSWQMEPVGS
ncbi:MAG: hypothetical protein OXG81_09165 [Acidobacteria bacterium]|nr:hypothetical protein [Acidobacteriota bacterium]